jgi:NAD-dependent dihydropyrimidine dehydrogenase PreA subunit
MNIDPFVEGPLLRGAFLVFAAGIAARLVFFVSAILAGARDKPSPWKHVFTSLGRSLFPFHNGIRKKPVYALIRYVFHFCLFVVPVFLFEHVVQWEESRFEWSWSSLPGSWADRLTLLNLAMCLFFLLRRVLVRDVRASSSVSDYLFLLVAAFPFLTGYLLSHGTPSYLSSLDKHMWTLHLLSGEIMLVSVPFLFCRTRLEERKCTGCAACVVNCPTGTLQATDHGKSRIFSYSYYQCIQCGTCVRSCPEDAGELRHEMSLRSFLPFPSSIRIRSVHLEPCEQCGTLFVPEPQLKKIIEKIEEAFPHLCLQCKKTLFSGIVSGNS